MIEAESFAVNSSTSVCKPPQADPDVGKLDSDPQPTVDALHYGGWQPPVLSAVSSSFSGIQPFEGASPYTFGDSSSEADDLASSKPVKVISPIRPLIRNHHLFTNRTMPLVRILWNIVLSKALQTGLTASAAIDVEKDSEEKTEQVVLRVYVQASAVQALAFWDGLDNDMGRWLEHLDSIRREIVVDKIGLRLHWQN